MTYSEYEKSVEGVLPPDTLEYKQAILWLHQERLPLGLVSLGDTKETVIRIPARAVNRYGKSVPVVRLSAGVFAGNAHVTDIILPSGIGSFPAGAFAGCKNLKNITIPKNVRYIPEGTFKDCGKLENIFYEGTLEEWRSMEIVHEKHEIEFGPMIPGTPVQSIIEEHLSALPGNEALFTANVHLRCGLESAEPSTFKVLARGKDITGWL